MNRILALAAAAAFASLAGCATDRLPADPQVGTNSIEQVLAKVNQDANLAPTCTLVSGCQSGLLTRDELERQGALDSKGYVMRKAYALQDAGVNESRMRIAAVPVLRLPPPLLLTENRSVLDQLYLRDRTVDTELLRGMPLMTADDSAATTMGTHHVLVVDNRYVLDNLTADVRDLGEYQRFNPTLAAIPQPLMLAGPRPNATRGGSQPK